MKKLNMIIGKKQIILACLTLILGIAVYLNYQFIQSGTELEATKTLEDVSNYGDAQFVSTSVDAEADANSSEYFAQARIDKTKSREEATSTLEALFEAGDLTEDELAMVTADAVTLSKLIESESKIETMVKASGFEDCLVYLDGTSANIIVKTPGLEAAQAAQIKDILLGEVEVEAGNITIVEVK